MPPAIVIPELGYDDVRAAVAWLCEVLGFTERLRIGEHRAQLVLGNGAIVVTGRNGPAWSAIMVRIPDVVRHHAYAAARGARVVLAPTDFPYGERQYTLEDLGGHTWTFSQTIADVAPEDWGGALL
ncbi:MAG: VOC family protein [Kofleriaceae bacterium]